MELRGAVALVRAAMGGSGKGSVMRSGTPLTLVRRAIAYLRPARARLLAPSLQRGSVTATLPSTHREPRLAARHAAATASCHCAVASARKIRRVDREMRWR
jgi:hypothetical protein